MPPPFAARGRGLKTEIRESMHMADQKIDGALFKSMVIEGALAIAENKERANELNVFPVPDGDTGTNMSMTMASAMTELDKLEEPTLAKAADTAASALLRGARGNSGVILSLLFRGMAKKLREAEQADGRALALALREGVDTAYKAVMKPAEGTILTVSRVSAQHAVEACQADPALPAEQVLCAVLERGREALAETVHQNPVLEKAGVVDAGAFGGRTAGGKGRRGLCRHCGRGDHVHLLHRVHCRAQRQGPQCRPPARDPERYRRFAGRGGGRRHR